MSKNFSSRHFAAFLFFSLFAAGGYVAFSSTGVSSSSESDFLSRMVLEESDKTGFSADMFSGQSEKSEKKYFSLSAELKPYEGEKSASLEKCIAENDAVATNSGRVTAKKNPKAVLTQSEKSVAKELDAVLGKAVKEGSLRWKWDKSSKEYIFETAKGDEKLWWCYLRNESAFLQNFLLKDQVKSDF